MLEHGGYARALAGEFLIGERQLLTRDGRLIPTLLYTATELDRSEHVIGTRAMFVDITELKQAERAFHESEERFKQVAENAGEWIWEVDANGMYRYCSSAVERILGYSPDELVGKKHFYDLFSPEVRDDLKEAALAAFERRAQFQNFVNPNVHKNGEIRLLETSGSPIQDSKGSLLGYRGVDTDITERKTAEEALRTSEAQLSNAVVMAHLGHWEYDVNKDLFTFNDHFYKIFRTTAEQVGGYTMSFADYARRFVHPDDMSEVGNEIRKSIESADPHFSQQLEHRILYEDGEIGHIAVRIFVVKDDLGHTVKTYGVNQDITERKRAEEQLQESEKRYRTLFETAADCIYILDAEGERQGQIISANPAAAKMHGYTVEEMLSLNMADLDTPESASNIQARLERLLTGETVKEETAHRRKDGTVFPLEINARLLELGSHKYALAIDRDITNRKRAEETLRLSEERLELALRGADLGLWDWHIQRDKAVTNQRAAEMIGYSLDEIEQSFSFWESLLHPDDRQRALEKVSNHMAGVTDHFEDEHRLRAKSGEWKWIFSRGKVTERDADGNALRMTGTYLDITEKKLSELQASEASELREKIFTESPMGIAVFRADGQCVSANEALGRIVGTDQESLVTQNFRNLSSWKDSGLLADAEQVLSGGMNNQREVHLTSTFGKSVWVNARMARLTSGDEPHLLIVFNDITERRTVEDALRFEREQLLSLFESINEVILVIDPRTYEILYANKFTEDLYGKKLIGGMCYESLNEFDAPCGHCHNEKILKLQGQPYQWEYSNPILKRNFLATDRMIRWPDGRDVKFQIAIDITERKEAEQEQEHLKAQLFHAQKMESIGYSGWRYCPRLQQLTHRGPGILRVAPYWQR